MLNTPRSKSPGARKRGLLSLQRPACGPPIPARIVVETPSKFYRYICHNSLLHPAAGCGGATWREGSGHVRKNVITSIGCGRNYLEKLHSSADANCAVQNGAAPRA